MDLVNKLHTDLDNASNSLAGLSAFSNKDKMFIGLLILLPIAINNLLYWFVQDIALTQFVVVLVGYFLGPFVLNKIIKKDIYILMEAREHMPVSKSKLGWVWLSLALVFPVLLLILGTWFNLLGVGSVTVLAPHFHRSVANYLYVLVASFFFCLIHPYAEGRFYFGVIDSILPNSLVSRIVLALVLTANYIGFSLAVLGVRSQALTGLSIIFSTYLSLAFVSVNKGVKMAILSLVLICVLSWVVFLLFVLLKQNGNYLGGVNLNLNNMRNAFN